MKHRYTLVLAVALACCGLSLHAQTAEDLVAKNLAAKGGLEKIKAIRSLRMKGKLQQGSFSAEVQVDQAVPDKLRQEFSMMGMTQIMAYDGAGSNGWQISPFGGRKEPSILGEDQMKALTEEADFHGPLVDYERKGNTIAYLGHELVDGDDAYRLRVTLKNGDILYYYLDPDTYLEIRVERVHFIRGSTQESLTDLGSYKKVAGVYFPFSVAQGSRRSADRAYLNFSSIEANIDIPADEFKMPAAAPAAKEGK